MNNVNYAQQEGCFNFIPDPAGGTPVDIYLQTPRGTPIKACSAPEFIQGSPQYLNWKNMYASYLSDPDVAYEEADASNQYNCHGFTFHMFQNGWPNCSPVKICAEEAGKYISDGSYSLVDAFNDAEIIWVPNGDHSMVRPSWDAVRVLSKWYLGQLVVHPINYNQPFVSNYYLFYARAHDVPEEHERLTDALNSAKATQVFKVSNNLTLDANEIINFTLTQKKLEIKAGANINLNSNYIKGKIILNGTVSPDIRVIGFDGSLVGLFSSIEQAYLHAGYGSVIEVRGQFSITQNLIIPNGQTVKFYPTASIICNNSIIIEGSLIANGATFNFSGGGFNVTTPGTINLANCTINGASTGLYINNRAPIITGCKFINCSTGISAANYSLAYLYPILFNNNNYGIYLDATSTPICGGSSSFRGNSWDIYSTGSGNVNAQGNYWGLCTPTPNPTVTNNIDYSYYICSDPWPNIKGIKTPNAYEEISLLTKLSYKNKTGSIANQYSFKSAQFLFISGKYDEAIKEAEGFLDLFFNDDLAKSAIVLIEMCYDKIGKSDQIFLKLNEIGTKYKTIKISEFIEYRKAFQLVNKGSFIDAVDLFKNILKTSHDSTIIKNALYQAGNLSCFYNNDMISGSEYLDRLITDYPYDALTQLAKIKNGSSGKKIGEKLVDFKNESLSISMQNYPNPFNPSTIIEYKLTNSGFVCLKIFDVLGREVKILVNELENKGFHKVTFDGTNHSSGNYFYRLEFVSLSGKKEILQKSMQIVK